MSAGCPTKVTITPSSGTLGAGDELTCRANGYNPTYTWTGTAGVNGAVVSKTGDKYTLPEGPFNVTCTATVRKLPKRPLRYFFGHKASEIMSTFEQCNASATVNSDGKYMNHTLGCSPNLLYKPMR